MIYRSDLARELTHDELDANFKACLGVHNLLFVVDYKLNGVSSGTFTAGAWRTRDLDTVLVNNIGAMLSSNEITLLAGTYYAECFCPAYYVNVNMARLYNNTLSSAVFEGSGEFAYAGTGGAMTKSNISGLFTLADTSVVSVQHLCQTTKADNGFGLVPVLDNVGCVLSSAKIWKVA